MATYGVKQLGDPGKIHLTTVKAAATHILNENTGKWEEYLHPRGQHGKFAKKPGGNLPKVKGHKPDYVPPPWYKLGGTNAKGDGNTLYSMKLAGAFKTDHEMYLAAAKLATSYKKKHSSDTQAASANQIYNAALRHEIDHKGKHEMLPQEGAEPPKGFTGKATAEGAPQKAKYNLGATSGGVKLSSKFKAPGKIYPTGKTMKGVSGAQVYEDAQGNKWLVKFPGGSKGTSKAYSNNKFLTDLDVATSRIQNKAGLPVPSIHATEVDGKYASVHKMYSRAADAFPDNHVDLSSLAPEDTLELQKNMVVDWLMSNHDPHTGNFLRTDKGIIGIDKGQSFKYFGKDKLTPNFGQDLNPPLHPNEPVYSTMMHDYIDGKGELHDFTSGEIYKTISRLQAIPDNQYKEMLRPYAESAAAQGLLNYPGKQYGEKPDVEKFLSAAVMRKNHLDADFHNLQLELEDQKAAKAPKVGSIQDEIAPFQAKLPSGYKLVPSSNPAYPHIVYLQGPDGKHVVNQSFTKDEVPNAIRIAEKDAKEYEPQDFHDAALWDGVSPDQAIKQFNKGAITYGELKDYVHSSEDIGLDDIKGWFKQGLIDGGDQLSELEDAFKKGAGLSSDEKPPLLSVPAKSMEHKVKAGEMSLDDLDVAFENDKITEAEYNHLADVASKVKPGTKAEDKPFPDVAGKLAAGYNVVPHPTESGKYAIQKPGGAFSTNKGGDTKGWDTAEAALSSSTMAKYKNQAEQQFQAEKASIQSAVSGDVGLNMESLKAKYVGAAESDLKDFSNLTNKIANGEHTPEDYANYKSLKSKLQNAKKAGGAAQVVDDLNDEDSGFTAPTTTAKALGKGKGGGMSWKHKGGAPPTLASIKGPDAIELGKQLWERKRDKSEFENVHELYLAAAKLSAQQKAKAQLHKATVQSGVDYSSANQIRNAALRAEYDETGDVAWSTTVQKTSEVVGSDKKSTGGFVKLKQHTPIVVNDQHKSNLSGIYFKGVASQAWSDKTKPPGSYENPHVFTASQAGKYTENHGWNSSQKSAWYKFTGSYSGPINNYFRTGDVHSSFGGEEAKVLAGHMLQAFKSPQVKPLEDWTVVTRGTSGGWEFGIGADTVGFDQLKAMEGKVVRNKCPASTCVNLTSPAFSGNPIRITYKLPPGFRGIWALKNSSHPGENEMITPPGMAYRILNVTKGDSGKTEVLVEVVDTKLPESV